MNGIEILDSDKEVREIEVEMGTLDVEVDYDGGQVVGEIDVYESEQPKAERKFGGGLVEDETFLEKVDPISSWESVKKFISKQGSQEQVAKEGARAVQALVDSESLTKDRKDGKFVSPAMAYKYRDMIDKGKEINPTIAAVTTTAWQRANQSWDIGIKQKDMAVHGADFILTGSKESKEKLQAIKVPSQDEEYISESLVEDSIRSAAKMMPNMADIGVKSAVGAVKMGSEFGLIATILGQAGPQALLMEEAVTVPVAIAAGIKTGAFIAGWKASFKVEGGLAVSELLDFEDKGGNKIDENIVRLSAAAIGGVNAFIEVAQLKGILNTIPVFNRLSKGAIKKVIAGEPVKKKLLELSEKYAGTLTKETFQEILQEVTNVVFEEGAKKASEDTGGAVIDRTSWGVVADRLVATGVDALKGFAVITMPGTVKSGVDIAAGAKKGKIPGTVEGEAPGKPKEIVPIDTRTTEEKAVDQIINTSFDRVTSIEEKDIDVEIANIMAEIEKDEALVESMGEVGPKTQAFRDQVSAVVGEDEAQAVTSLYDARAKAVGMTTEELLEFHGLEIVDGEVNGLSEGDLAQISAFHGSPNKIVGGFSDDKIGSGEGHAVFGYGHYLTDNEAIGVKYADVLGSSKRKFLLNGKPFTPKAPDTEEAIRNAFIFSDGTKQDIINFIEASKEESVTPGIIAEDLKTIGSGDVSIDSRNLYDVTIHKGKTPNEYNYLMWGEVVKKETLEKLQRQAVKDGIEIDISGGLDGKTLYNKLSSVFKSKKKASNFLLMSGVDGIKYPAGSLSGGNRSGSFNYVVFDPKEITIESERLLQEQFGPAEQIKASVTFTDTKTIIRAFETADVSSLVHELGHVFRRDLGSEDLKTAEDWAGVVDGEWTVPAEEKFARGWENYLATGQAPTVELQGVFEKVKQWMGEIYKAIKGSSIDVEVTPEIKAVFDRLLIPADWVDSLAQKTEGQTLAKIKKKHAKSFQTLFISERASDISIDSIIVPKEGRKVGVGTALMNDIISYADSVGKVVRLTPGTKDDKHGTTSRARLIKFYKKFGLVENKGRNKDFSYNAGEMYRYPSLKQSAETSQTPREGLADRNKLKVAIAKLEKLKEKDPAKRTATDIKNIRSLEAKKADIEKLISEGGKFVESLPRAKFKGAEGPASTEIELRRSIMNARKAMAKGDKAGVEKERARFQEIVKNAKTRRVKSATIKTLKANIKKELRTAKVKKHTGKFTPEIQDTLDTLIRVSKMKAPEAENKLVDNLETYLDKDIPQELVIENHMLEMVARLDTMESIGGLESLLAEIKALKDEGRMINQLKKFNRESRDIARKEITVEELGGVPDSVKFTGIKDLAPKTRMARAKQALKSHGKTIMGWDDLMDILSGKTKSKPGESFISKDNDLLGFKNKEKKGTRLAIDKMNANYKEAYGLKSNRQATKKMYEDNHDEITLKKVSFTDPIDGASIEMDLVFTRAELRDRVMKLMDPTLDATFAEMGYNQDTKADIFEALTDQDKAFIEMQFDFYREYYDGVNEVYKEYNGINLPKNNMYSPLRREGIAKPVDDGMGEFLKETSFRASAANPGASKARTANTLTISKMSDLSVMERHVSEMEHFKAWAEKIRDMNTVWKDPKVRAAVEINHGKNMVGLVDNFVADIANGASRMGQRLEGLDKFRSNVVKSMLAAKPAIMLKQLTSFVAFADKMPSGQFAKYMVQFWANPIKNTKDLYSSEMLKSRAKNTERDLKLAMQSKEHSAFAKHQSFFGMLMLNVQIGDQGAIVLGGWAYYKYLMDKKGLTHDQAIYKMEKAAEQSQQSGDITEQSAWQRGGSLAKLLTMFQSSQNQYIRKEIGALRNLFNGRQSLKQTAKTLLIFHVMLPMLFQFASDRFTWDEDEQRRAALFGSLNGYFIIGDALDYIIRYMLGMRTFDMEMPVYSAVHDFIKATALVDLFDLSVDEAFKAFESLGGLIGVGTGLPAKQTVRAAKGVVDSLGGEYEKGLTEIIGYSPYLADKLEKD